MKGYTILSDFLASLGVRHTTSYSDKKFYSMPFNSLFGFSRLLKEYGIDSVAYKLTDKNELGKLPTPYLSQLGSRFVVVDRITSSPGAEPEVEYITYHRHYKEPLSKFVDDNTGIVLLAYPEDNAVEPDYMRHHIMDIIAVGKKVVMWCAILLLMVFGVIYSGIWHNVSQWLLLGVDICGITVTWMLLQKSLRIHSHTADKVCGILQEHGCDTVLEQKASTFFGIFSWSEVGFTYFTLTTFIMLAFPQCMPYLALINGCCLPFTIWSISYQKFKIKTWCTLCVITQCLLWLQFLCYLLGGWWESGILPLRMPLLLMIAGYAAELMLINAVMTFIKKHDVNVKSTLS